MVFLFRINLRNNIVYCKVGLRSQKMTHITEYKPLKDGVFEYDVRSCPQKKYNHKAYFLCGRAVMFYRENWIFTPFLAPIVTFMKSDKVRCDHMWS